MEGAGEEGRQASQVIGIVSRWLVALAVVATVVSGRGKRASLELRR
jgi:hypothetical protein